MLAVLSISFPLSVLRALALSPICRYLCLRPAFLARRACGRTVVRPLAPASSPPNASLHATPLIAIIESPPRVVAEEVTNPLIVFYGCYYLVLCLLSPLFAFASCFALLTVIYSIALTLLFLVVAVVV